MILATVIASISKLPVAFYLIFAIGFGFGKGLAFPAALKAGWTVLPGRKGLVSGVVVSGIGLGSFMYGLVANKIANPDNLSTTAIEVAPGVIENYFPSLVNSRVPEMMQILAMVWCGATVASIFLI